MKGKIYIYDPETQNYIEHYGELPIYENEGILVYTKTFKEIQKEFEDRLEKELNKNK